MAISNRAELIKLDMRNQTDIQRMQMKKRTHTQAVRMFFTDFCANSTIHGIRYFTEKKRHWSERCWWIAAFGLSLLLCGSSIFGVWGKWGRSPVSIKLYEKLVPVSSIPFPTVTICPETKASNSKIDIIQAYHELKKIHPNLTNIELSRIEALLHVCQFKQPNLGHFRNPYTNRSIYDIIMDISPDFNVTIQQCEWQYQTYPCSKLFSPVLTEEGLCFSFNILNSNEVFNDIMAPDLMIVKSLPKVSHWNLEKGYDDLISKHVYPIRAFNARMGGALVVSLRLYQQDLEYLCRRNQGFKIILHTPGEIMQMSRQVFRVPRLKETEILIKPKLMITADGLRRYPPNLRNCFFSSERKLQYFKLYAENNCRVECLTNFTKIECGCVHFAMPRVKESKICGAEKVECYKEAEKRLFGDDIIDGLTDEKAKSFRKECNCLSACTSIAYEAEIDRTQIDLEATYNSFKISLDTLSGLQPSNLIISFKEERVVTTKRSATYTYVDFLAICGGLLGLFLGVSALSVIEFIYYSTLRLFWTLRQWKAENVVAPLKRRTMINHIRFELPPV